MQSHPETYAKMPYCHSCAVAVECKHSADGGAGPARLCERCQRRAGPPPPPPPRHGVAHREFPQELADNYTAAALAAGRPAELYIPVRTGEGLTIMAVSDDGWTRAVAGRRVGWIPTSFWNEIVQA